MLKQTLVLLVLLCVAGCAGNVRNFQISLTNDTPNPLTIALTKSGPPFEAKWAAPEDVAAKHVTPDQTSGMMVIQPSKTVNSTVSGRFEKNSEPVLRVYPGAMTFSEMLSAKTGVNRFDLPLTDGSNKFIVRQGGQGLNIETVH
ncbi:MAG TPA: hypothetical protein VFW23_00515 [Tepidisphaeraceae bacterium]|nr:hypothetical protein [Tepidisphaeraceae bacterium]